MHMSDSLISPTIGIIMYISTAIVSSIAIKKIKNEDNKIVPLMGVLGAFIFAIQMINFAIPGTGASGHIIGSILLAIILGPYAGFIAIAVIILIQALFFADGGILAYGCNVINMGAIAMFLGYPIYKLILSNSNSKLRIYFATIIASIITYQVGALAVVFETILSFKTEVPFKYFAAVMQGIHLVTGIIEGIITATIIIYLKKEKSELLDINKGENGIKFYVIFITLAIFMSGFGYLVTSSNPDGLEWSIEKSFVPVEDNSSVIADTISPIFPDYQINNGNDSLAGIIGVLITFLFTFIIARIIIKNKKRE